MITCTNNMVFKYGVPVMITINQNAYYKWNGKIQRAGVCLPFRMTRLAYSDAVVDNDQCIEISIHNIDNMRSITVDDIPATLI